MLIGLVACVIVMAYCLHSIGNNITQSVNKAEEEYKAYIGTKYVIDKDTLIVIDYSMWEDNFTLSNGVEVSSVLISKE